MGEHRKGKGGLPGTGLGERFLFHISKSTIVKKIVTEKRCHKHLFGRIVDVFGQFWTVPRQLIMRESEKITTGGGWGVDFSVPTPYRVKRGKREEEANKRFRMGGREGVRASPARPRPEEDAI